jgi:hypothetical protein
MTIGQLLLKGLVPFLAGDLLKIIGITLYAKY